MKKNRTEIDELLPQLMLLRRLMHARFVRASGTFDPYGWVRVELLRFIHESKKPSMQEIAEHLSITPASATSLVATLDRAGLVKRSKSPLDKRSVEVELTPEGKRTLAQMITRGESVITGIFSKLSSGDIRTLTKVLRRVGKANG